MVTAYIDESQLGGTGSGGAYFLAASIVSADIDECRNALLRLKPRRQSKLHWYESVPALRQASVALVSRLEVAHHVVVHDGSESEPSERLRRHCIERMSSQLSSLGVSRMVFESRGPSDDARDIKMLGALRARKLVDSSLRFEHVRGRDEPLLWIPDIVLGSITADRQGENKYFAVVLDRVQIIRVG